MDFDKREAFVISPIGEADSPERTAANQLLKYVIKPVVADDLGYSVCRADDIHDPGTISKQIIERLVTVPIVIADMTTHNPNVFYELAVRHAARLPVIHMIEQGEKIPFDVAPQRAIFYTLDLDGVEEAKKSLRSMVTAAVGTPNDPDSPLTNALDRLALGTSSDSGRRETQLLELVQDIHVRMINMDADRMAMPVNVGRQFKDAYEDLILLMLRLTESNHYDEWPILSSAFEGLQGLRETLEHSGALSRSEVSKLRHPSRAGLVERLEERITLHLAASEGPSVE